MSLKRLFRKITRKLKGLNEKQRNLLCLLCALILLAVLLLGRYMDAAPNGTEEREGETLPFETIQITQSET